MTSFDLTEYRVVTAEDVEAAIRAGAGEVTVREGAILTPSARDLIGAKAIALRFHIPGGGEAADGKWQAMFHSPEAEKVKEEIVEVGRKLWLRQYVDGNGGNISYRIAPNEVICTPTLISKADLKPEDMCLVDLDGESTGRRQTAHQRNSDAPGDLQGGSGGQSGGALPSAARHRLRHHRPRAAHLHHSGIRGVHRQGGALRPTKRRGRRSSPRP